MHFHLRVKIISTARFFFRKKIGFHAKHIFAFVIYLMHHLQTTSCSCSTLRSKQLQVLLKEIAIKCIKYLQRKRCC